MGDAAQKIEEALTRARDILDECSDDLQSDVEARWKPNGQIHVANERRYFRDMRPVYRARELIRDIDILLGRPNAE